MASLELRGVCKAFGPAVVVDELSLRVADGELLVLLGPSGCGKSTALRLIAGLESPDRGEIRIDDRVVGDLEPRERDVAMVFQSYALYPHMTARQNIAFPLRMARLGRGEVRARVAAAAELLGIEALLDRKPARLSGGQQQRVALARALVRRPRLFLLDEPLSNVDARLRAEMRAELLRLHRDTGITTVYVTHDQVEAMTLGDRIAVLADGRLQQVGTPMEIWQQPANVFVAGFVGAPPMNLLPGTDAGALRPPAAPPDCVVGFRPHQARLGGPLGAHVELVEQLGNETLVHARIGSQTVVLAVAPHDAPAPGSAIEIGVEPGALHAFEASSGARLSC